MPKSRTKARKPAPPHHECAVCGTSFPDSALVPFQAVEPGVSALIAEAQPDWKDGAFICRDDLNRYRRAYVEKLMQEEVGELGALEKEVVDSIVDDSLISENQEDVYEKNLTFGDRMADKVADFGGSWAFIITFSLVLMGWVAVNSWVLLAHPFDPYPFILLNLMLSCLAAFQAPIIMMSQGRKEDRDRLRAENDYQVNLKAELEIRQLREKIDHQLTHQWHRLAEMQQIQINLLQERADGTSR